jgi:hypothetical protein
MGKIPTYSNDLDETESKHVEKVGEICLLYHYIVLI